MTKFDQAWAENKLDMPRRRVELANYVYKYLPELHDTEGKIVADIGCGPGDFLAICRELGHHVQGFDAPPDISQMGEAYIEECHKHIKAYDIPVRYVPFVELCGELPEKKFDVINFRGSIEQCLSHSLVGDEDHKVHHNCKRLDWNEVLFEGICTISELHISNLMEWCCDSLVDGGVLLIAANGTKSTDIFYDKVIRQWAEANDFDLDYQEGLLLHRWVRS